MYSRKESIGKRHLKRTVLERTLLRKNIRDVSHSLMSHQSKDAHLGSSSIIQLNSTLLHLGLITQLIPSEVKFAIAVITWEGRLDSSDFTSVTVDHGGNQDGGYELRDDSMSIFGRHHPLDGSESSWYILQYQS